MPCLSRLRVLHLLLPHSCPAPLSHSLLLLLHPAAFGFCSSDARPVVVLLRLLLLPLLVLNTLNVPPVSSCVIFFSCSCSASLACPARVIHLSSFAALVPECLASPPVLLRLLLHLILLPCCLCCYQHLSLRPTLTYHPPFLP